MKSLKEQAFSAIRFFFGWPLSIAAILIILKITLGNSEKLNFNLSQIKILPLFYSFIFFFLYFLFRNLLWQKILKEKRHDLPLKKTAFLWAYSELRRFVPGKFWSFLSRAMLFSKEGVPNKTIASSILLEIEFFLVGAALVSLFSLSFILNDVLNFSFPNLQLIIYIFSFLFLLIFIFSEKIIKTGGKKLSLIRHGFPCFKPLTNLKLIIISFFAFFSFGLGTFFSIISLGDISTEMMMTFTGFFSFSFLAGYLSVIAPMGIGVREGMIALGLSKVTTIEIAGVAAIFSRIFLTLCEFLFLGLSFLWKNAKK